MREANQSFSTHNNGNFLGNNMSSTEGKKGRIQKTEIESPLQCNFYTAGYTYISCEWMIHPSFFSRFFAFISSFFLNVVQNFPKGNFHVCLLYETGRKSGVIEFFSEIIYYVRMVFNTYESSSESHLVKFIQSLVLLFLYSTTFIRLSCSVHLFLFSFLMFSLMDVYIKCSDY